MAAVQGLELVPQETPFSSQGEVVDGVENSAAFMQTAFALQDGEVSRPTSIGNHFVVVKLLERRASHIPLLEEIKDLSATLWCKSNPRHWHGRRPTNASRK